MKRTSLSTKLAKKRETLIARTADIFKIDLETAERLLSTKRQQSIRLNPLRTNQTDTLQELQKLGWQGKSYEWMKNGFTADDISLIRDSKLTASGEILIQNAASWLPVLALDPKPGEKILDICAAPGGKTSHIAAITNNKAFITANDNSRARLAKLQTMCQRMNAKIERFTLFDAQFLARKLTGEQFDKILLDAPCSGEGLINLERDKDMQTWSVAHIKRLQKLQKRLLIQSWQLLKPGGTLVYSTCTMAPEENEMVVDYALRTLETVHVAPMDNYGLANRISTLTQWNQKSLNPELHHCLRLKPSPHIEAFFVSKLTKQDC